MRAVAIALALAISGPATALAPASVPDATATPAPPAAIADTADEGADQRIAERLRGIFGELPVFANVDVAVSEGVVTLSGTVRQEEDIARAEGIAGRVSGVVTVENAIERDLSIEGGAAFESVTGKLTAFSRMLPLIGLALAVWLTIALAGYLIAGARGLWRRIARNPFMADLIASSIRFVFVVGGLVIALDILGATALLGAVLGGAGLIGIALGFAMRDTIENYVASLMLSLRQPFRANDHVVIDDNEGRVIRLTSRATILMTLDGNHLRIPNGEVFRATILNYTRNPQRRFEFSLGIDADDDVDAARQLGVQVLGKLDFILDHPEPMAIVKEVGDSNIVITFMGWIDQTQTDFNKARSRAIPAVKRALEAAGFALPEPIYRLRFDTPRRGPHRPEQREPASDVKAAVQNEDVSPECEVARMVDAERAAPQAEDDLLDSSKPVE